MKEKITLLIVVLSAVIFNLGCASSGLVVPEGGLDLRGSGMKRVTGDVVQIRLEKMASGSFRGSARVPRQGSRSGTGSFVGSSILNGKMEMMSFGDTGAKALRISEVSQIESLKTQMSGSLFVGAGKPDGSNEGPLDGRTFDLKKTGNGSWGYPFEEFQGFLGRPNLYPSEKVMLGHEWEQPGFFSKLARDMPESRPGGATMPNMDVKAVFRLKSYREFQKEPCAVISVEIPRTSRMIDGVRMVVSGSGTIYRSLDSYRNLKARIKGAASVTQTQKQRTPYGTATMSMSVSVSYQIEGAEEVTATSPTKKVEAQDGINGQQLGKANQKR